MIRYDTLLQNAQDIITKCDIYFITKFYQKFIKKFIKKYLRFFITKCHFFVTKSDSCCKMQRFRYKTRQLIQNAMFITKSPGTLFKPYIHQVGFIQIPWM